METLLIIFGIILLIVVVMQVFILVRLPAAKDLRDVERSLSLIRDQAEKLERSMREGFAESRQSNLDLSRQQREESNNTLSRFTDGVRSQIKDIAQLQQGELSSFASRLQNLTQATDQQLSRLRETIEQRLTTLQDENSRKLDQMREVVDEKLHATLEQRLGESFKLVSQRLELVHQGLGEMQSLATGVGDLKKVLTNVKARGTWGEIQLGSLLEQVLTPTQFARNVRTKVGSGANVEYAIKLPGKGKGDAPVWLPVDAKFPMEDYQRLADAAERGVPELVEQSARELENRIRIEAKSIRDKYLDPPRTTDFAIMYLPTEGLYAEVTRRSGLLEALQREFRVTVMGPSTVAALLNSLQMGFRTLAIEQRSSEVWSLLASVKAEFGRFGDYLEKTKKKLQEASNTIDDASRRSRSIESKLRDVQHLPTQDTLQFLPPSTEKPGDDPNY